MGGWCKERYNKDENNKLEGLHQKPDQMEETRWEGQNFSEVVALQEEEEEEEEVVCECTEPVFLGLVAATLLQPLNFAHMPCHIPGPDYLLHTKLYLISMHVPYHFNDSATVMAIWKQ